LVVIGLVILLTGAAAAADLDGPASIVFDQHRVPTIVAQTEHDALYLLGYMHAKDRLFQMDVQRRLFSGTISELFGPSQLAQDVQLRTLGLRRAAERSLPVQTPEITAWLEAYSDGVNAFLQDTSQPLPIEYGFLETDRDGIPPWTPVDSLTTAKGLAFGLSFDLEDIDRTLALLNFLGVGDALGFNGLQLFNNDLYRAAPFDPTVSIPPAKAGSGDEVPPPEEDSFPSYISDPNFAALVQDYRDTIAEFPVLRRALETDSSEQGSNWWIASGALTESGYPMIANDPHLSLGTPSTFYEAHLYVEGGLNVTGVSFPGAPGLVLGCNDVICWGATVNGLDVTDVYNEVLVPLDPSQPTTPTHILFEGSFEPLQFIPQTFLFNAIGDGVPNTLVNANLPPEQGGVTLIVPRRNNGPIVNVSFDPSSPTPLTGLSVQYTGWSGTQELEAFRRFAMATSPQDFKDGLQYFDVGAQNWAYADINGNIAYFTSAEAPVREDLQTLFRPDGFITPYLIRDGPNDSKHQWLPMMNPQPNQSLSTEILPFDEMPQVINPPSGYVLNANNDPIGTTLNNVSWDQFRAGFNGLYYLAPGYATGFRIGRLQRLWDEAIASGPLTVADYRAMQANNQLLDAEVLTPYLLTAYDNATAPDAAPELVDLISDPRIGEAIGRLAGWDFSTPTGINEGFDPGDDPAAPGPPTAAEIDASVAATIYSVWRGQVVQRVIDGTLASLPVPLNAFAPGNALSMSALRHLLDNYSTTGGTGASLINFFTVPGVPDQMVARDLILLGTLQSALDLLASDEMAPAFGNSTNLADYRWGKLHRIVFEHPMGGPFNIPPTPGPGNLGPDLPGISRAGGMGVLDASSHSVRADRLNDPDRDFTFDSGPARRFIATMTPDGPEAMQVIPGGQSGMPGSPYGSDQLALWLVNEYHPLPVSLEDVNAIAVETVTLACGDGVPGPGEECDDGNSNNADGCTDSCLIAPTIACDGPSVPAPSQTCSADIACDAVATCLNPDGSAGAHACAPGGPYAIGTTDVTVTCGLATGVCPVSVLDVTPPTISVSLGPDSLWPPNHRMTEIQAEVTAGDDCSTPSFVLESIVSSEPDDADGNGDGHTIDDIQDAGVGTADISFLLRAERAGSGSGRVYMVTYSALDASGNAAIADASVIVAHDQGGVTDPLKILLEQDSRGGTLVRWDSVPDAQNYNVIRASLSDLTDRDSAYYFGNVTCIESDFEDTSTLGSEDTAIPEPGEVFVYMVEYVELGTGERTSYGTETAAKPRLPRAGDCQ
jgi:penicillin amidase